MNKAQLVQAITERLGDRRTAEAAVDEVLSVIVRTVQAGESVTLTGFGVFERRERAARTGRNPRTGEPLAVAATAVPAFRAGATFRGVVSGERAPADPATPAPVAAATPATRRRPAPTPTEEAFGTASAPAAPTAKKVRSNGRGKLAAGAGKAGKGGKKAAAKGDKGAKTDKGGKKRTKK